MQTKTDKLNVLIIEDNPADYFLIEQMILASHLKIKSVSSASRVAEARKILIEECIDVVFLDLSLPDSFGINSFLEIKPYTEKVAVIILTGTNDSEVALEALNQGAEDYLVKGEFNVTLLTKTIEFSIEREKAKEKILVSEEKYRQIFYKNPFPMWINDIETLQILEVNDAAIAKYGFGREDFLNLTVKDMQSPEDVPALLECIAGLNPAAADKIENTQPNLWKHKKKNGKEIIVEFTSYPINYFGRTAMQVQINDITEKTELEKELAQQQKIMQQQITEAVFSTQERERKIIGEELHDNINQILATVKLKLGLALEHYDKRTELISMCLKNTLLAIEEVRKLSKALILHGNLKELGLILSVEELIKDIQSASPVRIVLHDQSFEESYLTEEQKMTIYRIVQEQINNILKHAEASMVIIKLNTVDDQISLLIADNGKGFDTRARRKGIGIINIISRAQIFNGKVEIDSSPGNGCRLKVVLKAKAALQQEAA
jgi:two-component system sensor histidine kinase UhpB